MDPQVDARRAHAGPSDAGRAPVGRLAPSPTGRLHLGHARSFLLAWWHARSRGGKVVLRIEDLDRERSRPELAAAILEDFAWLGLDWDGEPLVQSRDTSALAAAVERLLAQGLAYPCTCSRAEVAALSAPHAGESEPRYPGTCRGRWRTRDEAQRASGRAAGVRVLVPAGEVEIADRIAGTRHFDVAAEVGDFLVQRKDGAFAYQLAVVVDDARSQVSEVLRGDDLLPSAARQWHLQEHMGLPHPEWIHVPLVVDAEGRRLAKRSGDLALAELRARGVDPRAVVAWAARSAGQDAPERASAAEVLGGFDLDRLPRAPVRLVSQDLDRLLAARA
ncbi:MAG TPA: tRNA glutamyl-Q(34) synthetase GluQRS [Planctomycetota bacterium]|nr:tRNA glutamyl-Q(34) synthetase GluQRS [Planctomycetota bacterium]